MSTIDWFLQAVEARRTAVRTANPMSPNTGPAPAFVPGWNPLAAPDPTGQPKATVMSDGKVLPRINSSIISQNMVNVEGHRVDQEAYEALKAMRAASGHPLRIASAFRTDAIQAALFAKAVARYGSEKAAREWVAPPGRSAHRTGYALDLILGPYSNSSSNVNAQRGLPIWAWLMSNAHSFNFAPYMAEPWHWEYHARGGK